MRGLKFVLLLFFMVFALNSASATVINQNTTKTFASIQDAIDDPSTNPGHWIIVDQGTYNETIDVYKPLVLKANGSVTISNAPYLNIMYIRNNNVYVEGFRFVGEEKNGINIGSWCKNVTIINNQFSGLRFGVIIEGGGGHKILNNTFDNCTHCGIAIINGSSNTIQGNRFTNSRYSGIFLGNSTNNIIKDNSIQNSLWDGITVAYSYNNTISNNTITGGRRGLTIFGSKADKVIGNIITNAKESPIYIEYSTTITDSPIIQGLHDRYLNNGAEKYALLIKGVGINPEGVEEMTVFLYNLGYNIQKLIEPTREQVFQALNVLAQIIKPEDTCTIYINAHGGTETNGPLYSFLASPFNDIYNYELEELVRSICCHNKILILDSCHSGGVAIKDYNDTTSFFDTNTTIITATGVESVAFGPVLGKSIIDAFSDPMTDANKDGKIDLAELYYMSAIKCIPLEIPRLYENITIVQEFKPRISNLTVEPKEGKAPLNVIINALIANDGNLPGEYTATLYINGRPAANQTITLDAWEKNTITFTYTFNEPGIYNVTIDNLAPMTVTVIKPANIIMKEIVVSWMNRPAPVPVNVSCTLINNGDAEGNYTITLYIDGRPVANQTVTLKAWERRTVTFNYILNEPGTHNITINDMSPTTITVLKPANITAGNLSVTPASGVAPLSVTVSCKLTNTGDVAGDYTAELKINGVVVDSQLVTVGAGEAKTVTFIYRLASAGTYNVAIDGLVPVKVSVASAGVSLGDLVLAAKTVKAYYERYGRLPGAVTIAGQRYSMAQLLYLLTRATVNINLGNLKAINPRAVGAPTSPSGSYRHGRLYKSAYLQVAANILSFIDRYGRAPNYAMTSLGRIPFQRLVYMYTKIIAFYGTNHKLPNYVTI